MFEEITQISEFDKVLKESPAILAYFFSDDCNVCKNLKPKVEELIVGNFPQIRGVYINLNSAFDLSARYSVFVAPTIVIFLDSRELFRRSRAFGIHELNEKIKRPYQLLFS